MSAAASRGDHGWCSLLPFFLAPLTVPEESDGSHAGLGWAFGDAGASRPVECPQVCWCLTFPHSRMEGSRFPALMADSPSTELELISHCAVFSVRLELPGHRLRAEATGGLQSAGWEGFLP